MDPQQAIAYFEAIGVFGIVFNLGIYIVEAIAFYKMFKKVGIKKAWLAYIPFAGVWPFFWTIKKSTWNILWFVLPILSGFVLGGILWSFTSYMAGFLFFLIFMSVGFIPAIIMSIIWQVRLFKAFGMNPLWLFLLIGTCIPVVNSFVMIGIVFLYCYMGFSKEIQYHPDFDEQQAKTVS